MPKTRLLPIITLFALLVAPVCFMPIGVLATDEAAPKSLEITAPFAVYSMPGFVPPPVAVFAPQTVSVITAGEDDWYRIATYMGRLWVYLGNKLSIDRETLLFEDAACEKPAGILVPQVIEVAERDNDMLRIHTRLGDRWINLSLPEYYIPANAERYAACAAKMDKPLSEVYWIVNAGVDITPYSQITTIENAGDILALCDKNHALPKDYIPKDLRRVSGTSYTLREEAAAHFEAMRAAMRKAGLNITVISAYRSYARQAALYNPRAASLGAAAADSDTARPGHSEHQTGLCVDIAQRGGDSYLSNAHFEKTAQYGWLIEHAHEYGYILRYPKGSEHITGYIYEPWHWRYIGVENATAYHNRKLETLERYLFS